jgi:glycosyltransferase involved in cell wall biosynthesis
MGTIGKVDDDVGAIEMFAPARLRRNLADRAHLDAGYRFRRDARQAAHGVAALDQAATERAADKSGGTRHHNASHAWLSRLGKRSCGECINDRAVPTQGRPNRVALPDPIRLAPAPSLPIAPGGARPPKLLFLVTEDWYFWSHRLPIARAARDAGFAVVVATRVRAHGRQIRDEGFSLRPIAWQRRGDGVLGAARAIAAITRLYRTERPDIVHHVALKPVLFGGLARRLAFARSAHAPVAVDAVTGLGSGFTAATTAARLRRPPLGLALRLAAGGRGWVVAQNPEDCDALAGLGIDLSRIALIRGSGVDIGHFLPLAEPDGGNVRVALVSRMLRDKGVLEVVGAIRRLRARGLRIELLLAGPTDPDNANSLTAEELRSLSAEPGIEWLGQVGDVREVWRRAAIAVLPSTYGEGVPKALLEAAACGRPLIATDVPGCREVVRPGVTGLLVPPHNVEALAEAIAALAADPARRAGMGRAGRELIEREFADEIVAQATLALYRASLKARVPAKN